MNFGRSTRSEHPPLASRPLTARLALDGLLVDVCGVLYEDTPWRRWVVQMLSHMGHRTAFAVFEQKWGEYLASHGGGLADDPWDTLRLFLLGMGLSTGEVEEIEAAGHARLRSWDASILPIPGVRRSLEVLAGQHLPMAIVCSTSATARQVNDRVNRLGVRRHFQCVFAVREVAVSERRVVAYRTAAGALGLEPCRVGFISACRIELNHAAAAGVRTVGVNLDGGVAVDCQIEHLSDLHDVVALPQEGSLPQAA